MNSKTVSWLLGIAMSKFGFKRNELTHYAKCLYKLYYGRGLTVEESTSWQNFLSSGRESETSKDILELIKEKIERNTYKYTSCGAWVDFDEDFIVKVGSIVEGVDWGTEVYEIDTRECETVEEFQKSFNESIKYVEQEAEDIWNETHGCDDCDSFNEETGYMMINPNCKSCSGRVVYFEGKRP